MTTITIRRIAMQPDTVRATERVPHGGTADTELLEFSANVNPERPPGVQSVYEDALEDATRYPDDQYESFREAAAAVVDCDPRKIIPTSGGLAAIRLAIATTVTSGDHVLVPTPSFSEYAREVRLQGGEPRFVAHDELLDTDPADATLAIVCTPNNPTGEAADSEALAEFAKRCRERETTLLVDEAFLGFTDRESMAGTDGVVVARSLTKLYGLPGLRAGYAVATEDHRAKLRTARQPWALGTPAARVGTHCLRQREFVEQTRTRVREERAWLHEALAPEYDVFPSEAPFLLLGVGDRDVATLVARCRKGGVAIRDATTFRGLDLHVRVAVRTRAANERLVAVLST
jgi:L-threonine-O-3-phosphate decarboxylase